MATRRSAPTRREPGGGNSTGLWVLLVLVVGVLGAVLLLKADPERSNPTAQGDTDGRGQVPLEVRPTARNGASFVELLKAYTHIQQDGWTELQREHERDLFFKSHIAGTLVRHSGVLQGARKGRLKQVAKAVLDDKEGVIATLSLAPVFNNERDVFVEAGRAAPLEGAALGSVVEVEGPVLQFENRNNVTPDVWTTLGFGEVEIVSVSPPR